ncbi:hypothetical protein C8J56DRAFT_919621 [Mycena floridula]|nr:hypothetical protein C8J56DRAFT_919621 [Mycena floridula]
MSGPRLLLDDDAYHVHFNYHSLFLHHMGPTRRRASSNNNVRRASDPPSMSSQNIIIVVACSVAGFFILAIIVYRFIRAIHSSKSAPLPQRQPLKLHTRYPSRPGTIYDPGSALLSVPVLQKSRASFQSSSTSLLSKESQYLPSRDMKSQSSPVSLENDDSLLSSTSSLSPSSSQPFSARSSSHSRARSSVRSRPMSMSSANSTRTVIRGPPHSIHSSIQIVLPAPLAPSLYPSRHSSFIQSERSWATPRRTGDHRRASSQSSLRSASTSPSRRSYPSPPTLDAFLLDGTAPPVPRIPSIYMENGVIITGPVSSEARGRRSNDGSRPLRSSSLPPPSRAKRATLTKQPSISRNRSRKGG